ncbi:MAG: hypothetical protein ABFD76_12440 [Smithella sp.]
MKRFWLVLLSLGLVMAFSASALAVDVKVGAEYYAGGLYLNRMDVSGGHYGSDDYYSPSTAFFFQRLRVGTDFIVSPSLKLVTRFDAMERIWGGARSDEDSNWVEDSAGTRMENENIAIDLAYVQYTSPMGTFTAGYQNDGTWGTVFGDSSVPQGVIGWSLKQGAWTYLAQIVKMEDNSRSASNDSETTDLDYDKYIAGVIYNWKDGEAGARYIFVRNASYKDDGYPYGSLIQMNSLQPYVKTKIGSVAIQAELDYYWGKEDNEDGSTYYYYNQRMEGINFFVDAVADFKMFYVGGTFAYLSGDKVDTDKKEGGSYLHYGGATGGGIDWNPCLILFNTEIIDHWTGGVESDHDDDAVSGTMNNAWFFQGRVGVKPTSQSDVMLSLAYARADEKPDSDYVDKAYGW